MSQVSHDLSGLERVWELNAMVPEGVHDCIHNLVARTFARQPGALAVCAWDGEMTYGELDELASKLACELVNLGIVPGDIVPLLFEKSMWTPVAVLGIVKAGAAFVMLDSLLPEERLHVIVQQVQSKLILTSHLNRDISSRLSQELIIVGPALAEGDRPILSQSYPAPHPSSVVYIVFTSGSTGVPKGCVISHENLCSALHHQIQSLGFKPNTRVFDFASYSFDVAIHNIFAALLIGGCVCIPSEADRKNNLESALSRMQATLVDLTPTVARLLNPEAVPSLKTLILLGEMVTEYDTRPWWGKTQLINAYGPTECTSLSTINSTASTPAMVSSIGTGRGAVTWIVDPNNHNILLPWGQTGELLIEGPLVGMGYLNNPGQTATAFIEDPPWLVKGAFGIPGRPGRLYKTGDLARFGEDGNIIFLGRKDTQVKIRGNRVELGEVECHVRDCMPEATQVVAEAILPDGSPAGPVLAAFLKIPEAVPIPGDSVCPTPKAKLLNVSKDVEAELAKHFPAYMIPKLFFTMPELPLTLTGKTDRKLLREIGASLVEKAAIATQEQKNPPQTEEEHKLQKLYAQVLNLESRSIGIDDNFLQLGGDSFAAMRLVGEARRVGIKLTVADIFRHPVLGDLSNLKSADLEQLHEETSTATTLLDSTLKMALLSEIDSSNIPLRADDVDDILSLTNLQETLVVEGLSENRQFVDYYYLDLGLKVDLVNFKESCRQVLVEFPILRASFLFLGSRYWTVIPKHLELPFFVTDVDSDLQEALADFCLNDIATFERNQPVIAFVLLRNQMQEKRLVVRISHAQYDGISLKVIFGGLIGAYLGQKIPKIWSFSSYLSYISQQRERSILYWQKLLKGSNYADAGVHFRPKTTPESMPVSYRVEKETTLPKLPTGITIASFMSAAWAVFLSQILNEEEVVYGRVVNGRNAAIPTIEEIVGCCVTMVPVCVDVSPHHSIADLVFSVQEQFIALGEADSLGFSDIIENCTDWPAGSRLFTCAQHQNVDEEFAFEIEGFTSKLRRFENPRRLPYFLFMISSQREDKLCVQIFGHSHMMTLEAANGLLDSFLPLLEKLAAGLQQSAKVADLLSGIGAIKVQR